MKTYQLFLLALAIVISHSTFTNTTEFWKSKLNVTSMHYECYSGKNLFIQAIKKLTGIIPKGSQVCITACMEQQDIQLLKLMQEFL
jgi:hypothetical protein